MNNLEKLIELYRIRVQDQYYEIYVNRENNSCKKSFSSNKILEEAFLEAGVPEDEIWRNTSQYALDIDFSVFNNKERIDICKRNVTFYFNLEIKSIHKTERKSFLGIPYTKKWYEFSIKPESEEYKKSLKNKGYRLSKRWDVHNLKAEKDLHFIIYDDLIFEIDKELYKELSMLTVESLKERSIAKLKNAK